MATHIKFNVEQRTWSTGGYDENDSWSRDSTDGEVSILGAKKWNASDYDTLSIDADIAEGTTIYLVWAQYSTGDSFGNDGGNYELLDVFLDYEDARKSETHYNSVSDYSVPWNGYFESLDFIRIDTLTLSIVEK